MKGTGEYPYNWKEIADKIKYDNNNCCERCHRPHNPPAGYTLTVHHLDGNKSNNEYWNLAALCQRCHLTIQGKVLMEQIYMFDHTDWFKPHVDGYLKSIEIRTR